MALRLAFFCSVALFSGCKALDLFDRVVVDPSQAISLHADTRVEEAARNLRCNAPDAISRATLLADLAAVRLWQANRGVQFGNDATLAPGAYALVDMGQRPSGGYGLAVTRPAVLHEDGRIFLRGTFVEPAAGMPATAEVTSPCVLVKLPAGVKFVRVYDQTDRLRADSTQPNGVSEGLRWPF